MDIRELVSQSRNGPDTSEGPTYPPLPPFSAMFGDPSYAVATPLYFQGYHYPMPPEEVVRRNQPLLSQDGAEHLSKTEEGSFPNNHLPLPYPPYYQAYHYPPALRPPDEGSSKFMSYRESSFPSAEEDDMSDSAASSGFGGSASDTALPPYQTQARRRQHTSSIPAHPNSSPYRDNYDYVCEDCGISYSRASDLRRHRASVHGDRASGERVTPTFPCEVCGQVLLSSHGYQGHMRRHYDEPTFVCEAPFCGKAFHNSAALARHRRTHTTAHKFECDFCGRRFKREGNLNTHRKKHMPGQISASQAPSQEDGEPNNTRSNEYNYGQSSIPLVLRDSPLSTFSASPALYSSPFYDHLSTPAVDPITSFKSPDRSPAQPAFNIFDELDSLFESMANGKAPAATAKYNGSTSVKPTDLGAQLGTDLIRNTSWENASSGSSSLSPQLLDSAGLFTGGSAVTSRKRSDAAAHGNTGQSSAMSGSFQDITDLIIRISPTPIAKGGFAEVFEGFHSTAGKVALKRLKLENADDEVILRRFEREATAWRSLKHPHILEFMGTLRRDGHLYFVSPFVKNGTMVEYVGTHPEVNRIKLLCEAADAIAYVHGRGVVHGDIKANNILIDDNGRSLLCDFGLMKTAQSRTSTALRRVGTLRWQSPELWSDEPKTSASDVYAFGMTIAEVLTGKIPFSHLQADAAVMCAILVRGERPSRDPVASSTGVSYEAVWDIAADCWAPEPEKRINMAEVLQRLRADPAP